MQSSCGHILHIHNQDEMHNSYVNIIMQKSTNHSITIFEYNVPAPMVKTLSKSAQSAICL